MIDPELRFFLDHQVPEYEPARLDSGSHVLDPVIEEWINVLGSDMHRHVQSPPRSHRCAVEIKVAGVEARLRRDVAPRSATPRDAVCCLDRTHKDRFVYWLLFSRALIHDLYFLFAALELGPSQLIQSAKSGGTFVDVRSRDFTERGHRECAQELTSIALEFVCLHELTHAIRAHVPFLEKFDSLPRACLCEIGDLTPVRPSIPQFHQAVELDADLTALALQLHFASKGERVTRIVQTKDPLEYASKLGFVLGVVFRVFELWRRDLRGIEHNAKIETHPHPDVREVLCDAWLAQRASEPGELDPGLCAAVRQGRDRGQEAIEKLGAEFLPRMTYLQQRQKIDVQEEIEMVRTTLYDSVRPMLLQFVAGE